MIAFSSDIHSSRRTQINTQSEKKFPGLIWDGVYLFGPLVIVCAVWAFIQLLSYFFGVDLFSGSEPNTIGSLINSVLSVVIIIAGLFSMLWLVIIYPVIIANSLSKSGRTPGMKKVRGNNELFRENEELEIPDEIKGWSWGGFLWGWIWAIGNKTWIGLLGLIPYAGFVMNIILGIKGREWAWRNKDWMSAKQFNRIQRNWAKWWLILVLGFGVLGILTAGLLAAVDPIEQLSKARDTNNRSTAIELLSASQRYYAVNGYFPWNKSTNTNCKNLKKRLSSAGGILSINVDDADVVACLKNDLITQNNELRPTFFDNLEPYIFYIDISNTTSLRVCYVVQSKNNSQDTDVTCNSSGKCFQCFE